MAEVTSLGLSPYIERLVRMSAISGSAIVNPSEMIALGDDFAGHDDIILGGGDSIGRISDLPNIFKGDSKAAFLRHQGKANMVFCDGHVELPTLQFLFADTSDAALSRWNRDHLPHREELVP